MATAHTMQLQSTAAPAFVTTTTTTAQARVNTRILVTPAPVDSVIMTTPITQSTASAQSITPSAGMPANSATTCSLQSLLAHEPTTTNPTAFSESDPSVEDQTAAPSSIPTLSSPLQVPGTAQPSSSTGPGIKLTLKLPRPVTVPFTTDLPVLSELPRKLASENDKENALPTANLAVPNGKKGKQPKLDPKDRPAVANNTNGVQNLFKKHWLTLDGHNGTQGAFDAAWTSLSREDLAYWTQQSKEMKKRK